MQIIHICTQKSIFSLIFERKLQDRDEQNADKLLNTSMHVMRDTNNLKQ